MSFDFFWDEKSCVGLQTYNRLVTFMMKYTNVNSIPHESFELSMSELQLPHCFCKQTALYVPMIPMKRCIQQSQQMQNSGNSIPTKIMMSMQSLLDLLYCWTMNNRDFMQPNSNGTKWRRSIVSYVFTHVLVLYTLYTFLHLIQNDLSPSYLISINLLIQYLDNNTYALNVEC